MKKAIKIIAFVLAGVLIISSLFIIRACSAPPEYSEIRARVEYLIKASQDVNEVVWGKGLETYERVYDTLEIFKAESTYTDDNGNQQILTVEYHYYQAFDKERKVFAYRKVGDTKSEYTYAYLTDKKLTVEELKALFPKEDAHSDNELYYEEVLCDEQGARYAYCVPYTEVKPEVYYPSMESDTAKLYNYVRLGTPKTPGKITSSEEIGSVEDIKMYIRTVYSEEYSLSLYDTIFVGVLEGSFSSRARYTSASEIGLRGDALVQLNTYEPKFTERRVYLFETARINRNSSNNKEVLVEINSYLPSNPNKIEVAKIYFKLENGQWFLSTPTY